MGHLYQPAPPRPAPSPAQRRPATWRGGRRVAGQALRMCAGPGTRVHLIRHACATSPRPHQGGRRPGLARPAGRRRTTNARHRHRQQDKVPQRREQQAKAGVGTSHRDRAPGSIVCFVLAVAVAVAKMQHALVAVGRAGPAWSFVRLPSFRSVLPSPVLVSLASVPPLPHRAVSQGLSMSSGLWCVRARQSMLRTPPPPPPNRLVSPLPRWICGFSTCGPR